MSVNSNQKGKRGEREVVELLRRCGFEARRGQQFKGTPDSPDVEHNLRGLGLFQDINLHIEVKRTEALSIYKVMEQAEADAGDDDMPVIFHKRNNKPWVVCLLAEDFLDIMIELKR